MIKNYGFKLNDVEDLGAYKLGAIELPKTVLVPDGQWGGWTPIDELQHTPSFDSFGCTVYGTENIQQTLERRVGGKTSEYAERFNYNLVKITPPGADPHDVAQSFKNDGVIPYEDLPMTSTLEEYIKPRPVPNNLISKGIAHPWELRHQWLWQKPISKEERTKLIKEHLQYSPLGVSVTAWSLKNGVYVDNGQRNTHWTMLYGWNDKGWLIFDSYAPHRKVLSYDHNIECCKRYMLVPNTRKAQISIMQKLIDALLSLLGLLKEQEPATPTIAPNTPVIALQTQPEPIKLILWGKAIETYEGANKNWNNPGAIRGLDGRFLKFQTYDEGWRCLLDYLKRAATGKHNAYPNGGETTLLEFQKIYSPSYDNNDPLKYAQFVAKRLQVDTSEKIKNLV